MSNTRRRVRTIDYVALQRQLQQEQEQREQSHAEAVITTTTTTTTTTTVTATPTTITPTTITPTTITPTTVKYELEIVRSSSADVAGDESEDDERVEFRVKNSPARPVNVQRPPPLQEDFESLHPDDLLVAHYEQFGKTPPRTRIKNKNRDWDRKEKAFAGASIGTIAEVAPGMPKKRSSRMARSRVLRRNTMDCALLNEMFVNDESKRTDKRLQSLLRDSERELKNSMTSASGTVGGGGGIGPATTVTSLRESLNNSELLDKCTPLSFDRTAPLRLASKVVESCNRYRCVSSRPSGCRSSAPPVAFGQLLRMDAKHTAGSNKRKEFHDTFANLIKLGSVDRQDAKLSQEEQVYQSELKDLIWLELQAWHADRTLEQQDKYLFEARQGVPDLLTQILNYKFQPRYRRELSQISFDSGISSDSNASSPQASKICTGCMSVYCKDCMEQQEIAMREVEALLSRLEAAEALYPSSQAMGTLHHTYKSPEFVGRIKAMCLWYNITKQNKLKLCILGKILARLQGEKFSWPVQTSYIASDSGNSSASGFENDDSAVNSMDSAKIPSVVGNGQRKPSNATPCKVHFMLNDAAANIPGDASSSNESTSTEISQLSADSQFMHMRRKGSMHDINIFSVEPLGTFGNNANGEQSSALYRKFIENVLKLRGLAKSLAFLHKLHNVVLYKAHISLEKPTAEDNDIETEATEQDVPRIDPDIDREQVIELRTYGYWSKEAQSLSLPSYIPTFVFLSGIPLQFMHEFLRMRLETRPVKPNPLSLEQLMKELREGLTLALTHRERYQRHLTTALVENETELEGYISILNHYDATVRKVFELYLDYIDQLVLAAVPENTQKSVLEKEWMFTKLVCPMIKGMHTLASKKFCCIICKLLRNISDRLVRRTTELDSQITDTAQNDESELKWQVLTICRETQSLLTSARECSLKVLFFAKTFCRDVETTDFHREHYELDVANHQEDFICEGVKESFQVLQQDVLDVRTKLTKIIERVQERCCPENMADLDEQDRQAVLSRTREILHQGYKFGFEYHKDVIRLFEQRIMCNKTETHKADLALGIITFAKMWMQFVTERCERGRGMRPRWASQGLEFLILACDPQITQHLDEHQFEALKQQMDRCISHVIGITSQPEKVTRKKASPRSRKTSSPAASRSRTPTRTPMSAGVVVNPNTPPLQSPQYNKLLHPQFSLKEELLQQATGENTIDSTDYVVAPHSATTGDLRILVPQNIGSSKSSPSTASVETPLALRQERVRDAVNRLDMDLEEKLRERNLIGHVKALNSCDKVQIRARSVNFRWHRGIKIGQGRFGKVYTAVNNNTGELMAMKEIAIQPGETRALKNVAEELKILEGIKHRNLVRYYGIEVHREELLIFMELCSEGTLESLVELTGGLPEGLTRRFTAQLLSGVAELHKHGIVHRDIKTANIFLVDGSNSLKLGDFGSAVKIQAHTTVPGELQGYVGTQAYMAPEVFTKTNSDGHGRAADIWSVGCVVIEMASGKRPWAQFDSNFQIMFKVGMGEKPQTPESLSQEGHEFTDHSVQHDPKLRMTAIELLDLNFCKYGRADECSADKLQLEHEHVRHSFRRNLVRS